MFEEMARLIQKAREAIKGDSFTFIHGGRKYTVSPCVSEFSAGIFVVKQAQIMASDARGIEWYSEPFEV